MADELEEKLQGLLGDGYEGRLAAKISEFGGLLTRRAAVRLLCKELGVDVERRIALSAAGGEQLPFSFAARVDRIFPAQKFASGEKCVRLHVSDQSGGATLVLWNAQAALVEHGSQTGDGGQAGTGTGAGGADLLGGAKQELVAHQRQRTAQANGISMGDEIECRGAYVRSGEIHLGREGGMVAAKKFPATQVGKLTAGVCNVEGIVGELEPDYHYVDKKTGGKKKMSSFQLCEEPPDRDAGRDAGAGGREHAGAPGVACRRVVVWSSPEGTPAVEQGDALLLENVQFKSGEIHFNSFSRMVKKTSADELSGKVESVAVEGGAAVFAIGKSEFRLPLADALVLLGMAKVPQGVLPSTLLSIKAQSCIGRRAIYHLENGKLAWLRVEN